MNCPYCKNSETRVVDSREAEGQEAIRRRRECTRCGRRFTTYEKVEDIPILVLKRNGSAESFSREKLLQGVVRACTKRDVPLVAWRIWLGSWKRDFGGRASMRWLQRGLERWSWIACRT